MFRFFDAKQPLSKLILHVQRFLVILTLAITAMAMAFTSGTALHNLQISIAILPCLLLSSLHFPDRPQQPNWHRILYIAFESICLTASMLFGVSRLCLLLYMVIIAKTCLLFNGRTRLIVISSCLGLQTAAACHKSGLFTLLISGSDNAVINVLAFTTATTLVNGASLALLCMAAALMLSLLAEQKSRLKSEQLSREIEQLASELERARIAREIHDTLGHTLTSLKLQMEVARLFEDSDRTRAKTAFGRAEQLSALALTDVRVALQSLREQDFDLDTAIGSLKANAETSAKLEIESTIEPVSLPAATSYQLFRIIQECMTNTMKHARATRVQISSRVEQSKYILVIKDDGIGINKDSGTEGYGIRGMRERVANLAGTIEISNPEGTGTAVTVTVPIN